MVASGLEGTLDCLCQISGYFASLERKERLIYSFPSVFELPEA